MNRSVSNPPSLQHGLKRAVTIAGVCGATMAIGVTAARLVHPAPSEAAAASIAEAPAGPSPAQIFLTAEEPALARRVTYQSGALKRRDTLVDLLIRLGADGADANNALREIYQAEYLDPRRLLPGMTLNAMFETEGDAPVLAGLSLRAAPERTVVVTRNSDDSWTAAALDAKLSPAHKRIAARIDTSIYEAALADGATDQQVVDFARIFAYDVDFQREIYPGDQFEIVYETWADERGEPVKTGEVLYAELKGKALTRGFYRYTTSDDGVTDYYDASGESATKFLMKTPINGARLSSGFGRRRHPISGYSRMHKGTDFAAPTGTPVYAAGNGVVERASRWGTYGNYVRIRHANGYKTAYAHLSRYGRYRTGQRVRQGDVIGYVGSTGGSTGPHLHYEVLINGSQVNAMSLKLPTGRKLEGEMLEAFQTERTRIDTLRLDMGAETEYAAAPAIPDTAVQ